MAELQADAGELLTDLRELAHGIHPPVLSDGGLVAAVESRAGRLPLDVTVRADDALRVRRLDADVEAAYFVICEALTNVVKHANASRALVNIAAVNGHLSLLVRDDGTGQGAAVGYGQGLTNLRGRVEALGGRFRVDGRPGGGNQRVRGPAGRGRRCLTRCGSSSPRTTTSFARAPAGCPRIQARSTSSPPSATRKSCATRSGGSLHKQY
jgi:signal transduction histidine kinase